MNKDFICLSKKRCLMKPYYDHAGSKIKDRRSH